MKKIAIIVTVLSVLFSSILGVAADSIPKDIEVILSDTPAVVNLGQSFEITATAPKHGSNYIDSWENAEQSYTELNALTNAYISKATFKADKEGIYNISYTIKMTSGNSDTVFYKTVKRTVEVVNPVKVVGAVIRNLNVIPIYNGEGNIAYYRACGEVYALWSDKSETPDGSSVYLFFGSEETSKDVSVTLNVDGKQYDYIVTVNR